MKFSSPSSVLRFLAISLSDLGLSDQIEPMMLVKQWERELEVVTPTVQVSDISQL